MRTTRRSWPDTGLVCRILFGCTLWIGGVSPALGTSHYVSNSGDDRNAGTSASGAWRTLDKVNRFPFAPGDVIHFERGGVWHGQLVPRSGSEKGYVMVRRDQIPVVLGQVEDLAKLLPATS